MTITEITKKFEDCKILCIGDVMLDKYVYGYVERISPEAPVPIHCKEYEAIRIGGAGTVLRNITALRASAYFVSVIGADNESHQLTHILGNIPNTIPYLIVDQDRVTTCKTRFMAGTHQVSRADYETTHPISKRIEAQIIDHVRNHMDECDAVTLSDYGKGIFSKSLVESIVECANAAHIPVIVDPKSPDFTTYDGATVITPNLSELFKAALFSSAVPDSMKQSRDVESIAPLLMGACKNILVTRSKDGMTLIDAQGQTHHIPAAAKEVYDVTGAGDTVVAVLALGMAAGLALPDVARLANKAAGIVVGKMGAATVSREELCDGKIT